jgi:TRAP transporter TAXI family solute receptor
VTALVLAFAEHDPAVGQADKAPQRLTWAQQHALRVKLNEDTLILAAGRPGATYLAMANDLVATLGANEGLRLVPVAGSGGLENLQDLLFLRGIDMAIVPANALVHAKASGALGGGLPQRTAYIASLYGEEVHVLAGRGVASLTDLQGRKVAVPADDGTAQFTARDIFRRLGVEVEQVGMGAAEAIGEMRTGEIAATVLVGGKPLPFVSALPKDGSVQLIGLPFSGALEEGYSPAVFQPDDYPALVAPGALVETLAVGTVLMAHSESSSEEQARRIARFVPALFGAMSRLAVSQRHPKWKEVNLGAALPGWPRAQAAETWLKDALQMQRDLLKDLFEEFLRSRPRSEELSAAQRKQLFEEFERWTRKSINQPAQR